MSKEKLSRIIRHLEKTGKIWGYSAVVDEEELPYKKFIVLLKRLHKTLGQVIIDDPALDQFRSNFQRYGITIESVFYLHGEYDWMVLFTAPDLARAKKFSSFFFDLYPEMADKVSIFEILYTHKLHFVLNPNQSRIRQFI